MSLARGQTADRARDVLPRDLRRLLARHSFEHLSQSRAAGQRRRATVSQKPRLFDNLPAQSQREAQAVAAHRIALFRDDISVRQFTCVTRVGDMIFESFGVRQKEFSVGRADRLRFARASGQSFLIERREAAQVFDGAGQDFQDVVHVFIRIVLAEAETNRAAR